FGFSSVGDKDAGFLAPVVLVSIIVGAVSLILFCFRQLKIDNPVLDIRVFKFPMFSLGVVFFVIVIMGMFASEIILPIFMQGPLALSAATAGLLLLPGSLLNGLLSPVMGKLFDKLGPRKLMMPGSLFLVGVMFTFSKLDMTTEPWVILVSYIILMISISAMMMPAETNGLNQLPKELYTHGTAIASTLRAVSGAIGGALFISIMSARQKSYLRDAANPMDEETINQAMVAGVELVYHISFVVAIIAFILSF